MTNTLRPRALVARGRSTLLASALLVASACGAADLPNHPTTPADPDPMADLAHATGQPGFATVSTGSGIVFGGFGKHTSQSPYKAQVRLPSPSNILSLLAGARAGGIRVLVKLGNHDSYTKKADGSFDLEKWKVQVARFRDVDFASYIRDGTLMGHYLIDEPYDASNWGGQRIAPATLEEMAKYSKRLWPDLTTFVRAPPEYLAATGIKFQYLDAGWAMYEYSKSRADVRAWILGQVAAARKAEIGLIVGLNVINGGNEESGIRGSHPTYVKWSMSATQLRSWGATLLNESNACGFFNWQYEETYHERSDIKSAMAYLFQLTQSRPATPCGQGGSSVPTSETPTDPPLAPSDPPETSPTLPSGPASGVVYAASGVDNSLLGSTYGGSLRQPGPGDILRLLAGARASQGQLILKLGNSNSATKNSDGTFSLEKWKTEVNRFKAVDVQPYINDGTLAAHLLIDAPENVSNWGGQRIPQSTLEAMAAYSKQLWPDLTTIVGSRPSYLAGSSTTFRHLDAGWTLYQASQGEVSSWLQAQVAGARKAGVGLLVGLNVLNGGSPSSGIPGQTSGRYAMSASELRSWGSALLNEPYVCGIINWRYDAVYDGRSDIRSAMAYLAQLARSHAKVSCG